MQVKYEIIEKIAIISETPKWTRELNKVSWEGKEAKYDFRYWRKGNPRAGRGTTMSVDEIKKLNDVLNNLDL